MLLIMPIYFYKLFLEFLSTNLTGIFLRVHLLFPARERDN